MSRLRTLFTTLVLALVLAAAAPAPSEAAGSRRNDPGVELTDIIPHWIVNLFDKIWLKVAPPNGDGGAVTTNGDGGDTGWHIDPNG